MKAAAIAIADWMLKPWSQQNNVQFYRVVYSEEEYICFRTYPDRSKQLNRITCTALSATQ